MGVRFELPETVLGDLTHYYQEVETHGPIHVAKDQGR